MIRRLMPKLVFFSEHQVLSQDILAVAMSISGLLYTAWLTPREKKEAGR